MRELSMGCFSLVEGWLSGLLWRISHSEKAISRYRPSEELRWCWVSNKHSCAGHLPITNIERVLSNKNKPNYAIIKPGNLTRKFIHTKTQNDDKPPNRMTQTFSNRCAPSKRTEMWDQIPYSTIAHRQQLYTWATLAL